MDCGDRISTTMKNVSMANLMTRSTKMEFANSLSAAKGICTIITKNSSAMPIKTSRDGLSPLRFTGLADIKKAQAMVRISPSTNSMRMVSKISRRAPHCM